MAGVSFTADTCGGTSTVPAGADEARLRRGKETAAVDSASVSTNLASVGMAAIDFDLEPPAVEDCWGPRSLLHSSQNWRQLPSMEESNLSRLRRKEERR